MEFSFNGLVYKEVIWYRSGGLEEGVDVV